MLRAYEGVAFDHEQFEHQAAVIRHQLPRLQSHLEEKSQIVGHFVSAIWSTSCPARLTQCSVLEDRTASKIQYPGTLGIAEILSIVVSLLPNPAHNHNSRASHI